MMSLEDELIALEQRVLLQAAGDFLAAVEQLRQMLVRGTPDIGTKLISLAIPQLEQAAKAGVAEGFQLGAADALTSAELLPHVDGPGGNALGDARQRLQTFPERLSDPLSGIDRFVADAKMKAVVLHTSGARIEESLAPIFQASNAIVSRVSTSINAAGNEAVLEVGDAVDGPLVWQAERDACVYCLALAGEVVQSGAQFPKADLYADPPPSQKLVTRPALHNHCRCTLALLGDASYADALKREAQRSILRGFALPTESNAVRVRAAARLLDRDPVAPKSVKAYAAKAVKAGKFPTRDVPDGGPRLVVDGRSR